MRWVLGALALALVAQPAGAQPAPDTDVAIAVAYRAPAECPGEAELGRQIRARSARIRIGGAAAKLDFEVVIEPRWRARIVVRDADGVESLREVNGETCREVVSATALIVAVLADPDAPSEAPPATTSAPPSVSPTPARAPKRSVEPEQPWPWQLVLGMQLSIETAPAPDPILAPRPFIALERRPGALGPRPALRLSVARGSSGSIATDSGIAELSWTAARLDGCIAIGDDDGPSAQPCATFELGALRGRGFRTLDPNAETVIWLAPGLLARGAWGIARLVRLELQAGLAFPLRRYRFFFGPDETAHRVPAVGGTLGLGIAVVLP